MDAKEEGILLGELKEFKKQTQDKLASIEAKVDSLDKFKIKVTLIMAFILGAIELSFRAITLYKK